MAPVERSISPAIISWTNPMLISPGKAMVRRTEKIVTEFSMALLRE